MAPTILWDPGRRPCDPPLGPSASLGGGRPRGDVAGARRGEAEGLGPDQEREDLLHVAAGGDQAGGSHDHPVARAQADLVVVQQRLLELDAIHDGLGEAAADHRELSAGAGGGRPASLREDLGQGDRVALDRHGEARDMSEQDDLFWRLILEPLSEVTESVLKVTGNLSGQYLALRKKPTAIRDYARVAGAIAGEIGRLVLMAADSPTRFKGKPGTVKRVAWSEPLSLSEIKAAGKALGCSVNDTLLASVAGALRGYLLAKGDAVNGAEIRAMVPVNLRAANDSGDLGNRFGLVALELPVGIENPLARLYATRARMAALKGSHQALLTYALLGAAGMAPGFVEEQLLRLLAGKTTAVMTNVPGPQQPRYLAGQRIDQQMVWVPQTGDIGMGVSILSYNNRVQLGVITDKGMVDDPQNIVDRFSDEFERLLWLVLLEPGDRLDDPEAVEASLNQPVRRAPLRRQGAPSHPSA